MDSVCVICLSDSSESLVKDFTCPGEGLCKFQVHSECIQTWYCFYNYECPICHVRPIEPESETVDVPSGENNQGQSYWRFSHICCAVSVVSLLCGAVVFIVLLLCR